MVAVRKVRGERWVLLWCLAAGGCGGAATTIRSGTDAGVADSGPIGDGERGDALLDGQNEQRPEDGGADLALAGEVIDTVVGAHDTYRTQIADIVPLGDDTFVVGYRDASDRLQYARWDEAGRRGPLELAADGVRWVRADTSEVVSQPDSSCSQGGATRISTLAVQTGGDAPVVRLDIHSNCDGRTSVIPVPLGPGVRPSAVTVGARGDTARTLVVYGRAAQLVGRFVTHAVVPGAGVTLGDEFSIAQFSLGGAFSTDVIHNRHSNRFIVGYIQRGGFGCSVWNVVLDAATDPPKVVDGPTQFGLCDGDQGGHHTSVAYNPRGDGRYVWLSLIHI